MVRKISLLIAAFVALAIAAPIYAQDPGIQDSIIIGSTYVDSGTVFAGVPLYVVTDDTVAFYHMAIHYATADTLVRPRWPHIYFPPIIYWGNCCDTVYWQEHYMDFCRYDFDSLSVPPLFTNGQRVQIMTLAFNIGRGVSPQLIVLDTTWNPRNGSTFLGLNDYLTEFTPAIQPGFLAIGPGVGVDEGRTPRAFSLSQNYPNPFNPSTNIDFALARDVRVSLVIYDLLGRHIRTLIDKNLTAGRYDIIWDGRDETGMDMPSGVYLYRLVSSTFSDSKRMVLVR